MNKVDSPFYGFPGYPTGVVMQGPALEMPASEAQPAPLSLQERVSQSAHKYLQSSPEFSERKHFFGEPLASKGGSRSWLPNIFRSLFGKKEKVQATQAVVAPPASQKAFKLDAKNQEAVNKYKAAQKAYVKFVTQDAVGLRAAFLRDTFEHNGVVERKTFLAASESIRQTINARQEELRKTLESAAAELRSVHKPLHEAYERALQMNRKAPGSVTPEQLKDIEGKLKGIESEIEQLSAESAHLDSALSSVKVQEYKLSCLESCLARAQEQGNFDKGFFEFRTPKLDQKVIMDELTAIEQEAHGSPPVFLSQEDAIKQMKDFKERYKWGCTVKYENMARQAPHNWTNSARVDFKYSPNGSLHATVIQQEPILVMEEAGVKVGVPAALRDGKGTRDYPTNLVQATSYFIDFAGEPQHKVVSWRGGQFPTKEAAKKALIAMGEPSGKPLHINSLLTPTALTAIKPDAKLLEAHKKNLEEAYQELLKEKLTVEVKNLDKQIEVLDRQIETQKKRLINPNVVLGNFNPAYALLSAAEEDVKKQVEAQKASTQKLENERKELMARKGRLSMESLIISNFGVNEGATRGADLIPGIRTSVGHHSSFEICTNAALTKLDIQMKAFIEKAKVPGSAEAAIYPEVMGLHRQLLDVIGQNQFLDAAEGDYGQFKAPALWKAIDVLTGGVEYTNCMSGKDRTGAVEAVAQRFIEEARMSSMERKPGEVVQVPKYIAIQKKNWGGVIADLTEREQGFDRQNVPSTQGFRPTGYLQEYLPEKSSPASQRAAKNAEKNFLTNINRVTTMNTGVAGSKAIVGKGNDVAVWEVCGFSRAYMIRQIGKGVSEQEIIQDLGLERLGAKEKTQFQKELQHLLTRQKNIREIRDGNIGKPLFEGLVKDIDQFLQKVALAKAKAVQPSASVAS